MASFPANDYDLYDMIGNLSEWTGDCYINDYDGKGTSQDARELYGCQTRVVRGANWSGETTRFSHRRGIGITTASNRIGFRVARELARE